MRNEDLARQALAWLQQKSSIILLLPFVHLCVCFFYLAVYFTLFGHSLSSFADTSDVFSVSFTNIVPFYISVVVGTIGGTGYAELFEEESRTSYFGCLLASFVIPNVLILLYWLALIVNEYMKSGFVLWWWVWLASLLALSGFVDLIPNKTKEFKTRFFVISWLLISLFINAGLHAQHDQFQSYAELKENGPLCRENVIVNKLGDQYLVVRPDNSRWLADEKCGLGARLAPPTKHTFPQHWSFKFWPF